MSNYYYLVAGLPSVSLDDGKLSYTVENFKSELYPSLSDKDKKLIDLFYLKFDNINLLKLLKDKDAGIDERGNFSAEELLLLIEAVRQGDACEKKFPSYLSECEQYPLCFYFAQIQVGSGSPDCGRHGSV